MGTSELLAGVVISFIFALVPTVLYVLLVYWVDRYEKEPKALLAASFLWGALPAVVGSLILQLAVGVPLMAGGGGVAFDLIQSSAVAPIVEEVVKGLALVGLVIFFRGEFDGVLDGVIYGALIGFGFAMTENFLYFISSFAESGIMGLLRTAVFRAGVFGFNHAIFTSVAGACIGYGLVRARGLGRLLIPALGLVMAISLHAIHNFGVTIAGQAAAGILLSLANIFAGTSLMLIIIIWSLAQERSLIRQELHSEVGRTITQGEYELLTSQRAMLAKTVGPLACIGGRPRPLLYELGQLATELAFKKHRIELGDRHAGLQSRTEEIRQRIAELRKAASGIGPASLSDEGSSTWMEA